MLEVRNLFHTRGRPSLCPCTLEGAPLKLRLGGGVQCRSLDYLMTTGFSCLDQTWLCDHRPVTQEEPRPSGA
jgi:hypothetical protein